jgi:lysophospholipase L1-like esterase
MTSAAEARPAAWFCAGSLALSAALAARFAIDGGSAHEGAPAFAAAAAALALAGFASVRFARGRAAGPLVALATLNLLVVVPELGLRGAGFRYVSGVEFGFPEPELFQELEPDRDLFWKLPPGAPANRLGFFGPDPRTPKPDGTFRWIALGDSCAQQAHPRAWPELAAAELERDAPGLEVVNLSMSGYSSHQGLALVERHGAELEPDLAAVAYGWNDHWLARGAIDAEKRIDPGSERLYRSSRLLQALRKLAVEREWISRAGVTLTEPRVAPGSYRENLERIVASLRRRGARVVLLTIPSSHGRLGVPGYLVEREFAASAEAVLGMHRAYNEIVREVAGATGAELLDLAAELDGRDDVARWFLEDGIHFSEEGRAEVARRFVELARARELVPRGSR